MQPAFVSFLACCTLTQAQWIFPPATPAGINLTDYTSGKVEPIRSFHIHDSLIGSFSTPRTSMSITRCARKGRTKAILPSKESFMSTEGHLAADGTWQMMEGWSDWFSTNHYSSGRNLFVVRDFEQYMGNETTGTICWWELYRVQELQMQTPFNEEGVSKNVPQVTLLGEDTENYFASTPFVINSTSRGGSKNYTWRDGDRTDAAVTITISTRPTGNVAPNANVIPSSVGLMSTLFAIAGIIFGASI